MIEVLRQHLVESKTGLDDALFSENDFKPWMENIAKAVPAGRKSLAADLSRWDALPIGARQTTLPHKTPGTTTKPTL